jgi:RNA polymerase sigma factor (sigma-70 family)
VPQSTSDGPWTLADVLKTLQDPQAPPARRGQAWEALYQLTRPLLFATSYRLARGDYNLVEDVCQHVYLKLWQRQPFARFQSSDHLLASLRVMVAHTTLDHLRVRARQPIGSAPGDDEPAQTNALLASTNDAPEAVAVRNELHALLLAQLTAPERELFGLVFGEPVPAPEIAKMLNISPANVAVRTHRLRERLRQIFLDLGLPAPG